MKRWSTVKRWACWASLGLMERQWICHLRPTLPQWEDQEDIPFTNTVRNKIVRWVLATLWSSVISFLCRPDLTVGTADPETGNLYTMELMDSRWQWPRNQGGWGCCNGQQSQSSDQTIDSEHIECKGVQASLRKEFGPLPKIYTVNLSPSLL